jgi:hypothetical protein
MRVKNQIIILMATMAMASATNAFAVVLCGLTSDNGSGEVQLPVTSSGAGGLLAVPTSNTVGPVTVDVSDCAIGDTSCTVVAQGTPGDSSVQLVTLGFTDDLQSPDKECSITKLDGLPVELSKFSVE